jgi:protein gp37
MSKSKIEWTGSTWNPTTGCTKLSAGCQNCYAFSMAIRLKAMGIEKYANGFNLTLHPKVLNEPQLWKRPRTVFVNSMSDLFHEDIPESFILETFKIMNQNPLHTFQVLTKRAARLAEISDKIIWTKNIWMGVTVESAEYIQRIDCLNYTRAFVKFLSLEPLLGPLLDLNLSNIDWVIVGGESGPKSRPISEDWVLNIRNQCHDAEVPFFFKQWGGRNKKKAGKLLQGEVYCEMPTI